MPKLKDARGEGIDAFASTPATLSLLLHNGDRKALPEKDFIYDNTICAKALYLDLHTRPDILLTAAMLICKVAAPTNFQFFKIATSSQVLWQICWKSVLY